MKLNNDWYFTICFFFIFLLHLQIISINYRMPIKHKNKSRNKRIHCERIDTIFSYTRLLQSFLLRNDAFLFFRNVNKYTILFVSLFLLVYSCKKEGPPQWDVSVLSPLIKTSMGIDKIVPDSLLQTNPDNSLAIVFDNTLYNFSLDSLIEIPDSITTQTFQSPISALIQPGMQFLDIDDNHYFSAEGAQITDIIIRTGFIKLALSNTIHEDVICTYTIPCATKNGAAFQITKLIPAATNVPSVVNEFADISGYSFNLRGIYGNSSNTIVSHIGAWIDPAGNPVNITTADHMTVSAGFNNLVIDYVKGYFGKQNLNFGPDTADFSIFKNIIGGHLNLEKIKMSLTLNNGFGLDARVILNQLKSINSQTNHDVNFYNSIIGSAINISRATETGNSTYPVNPSNYMINLDNSNIKQFIENLPDKIAYSLNLTTNPLGNVSCGNDFAYYNNGLKASMNLQIPLSLIANDLTLQDTVDLNISKPADGSRIKDGIFYLDADNGFPFNAEIQLYLLSSNNVIIDSILTSNYISSGILDANNKVISKTHSNLVIPLSENKLNSVYDTKKMIIRVKFNTANAGQYIKIYSDYKIDMKLKGDFNFLIQQ